MSKEEKSGEACGVNTGSAEEDSALAQLRSRGICPEHDHYTHHLSDRQHFRQSPDPKDGHRSLGVYPPGFMFQDDGA